MDDPKSILITRLDGLGDIVLGTTLLQGLHERWPSAELTLLVRPQHDGVAAILPDWVRTVTLPFDPRGPVGGREQEIAGHLRHTAEQCAADMVVIGEYNRVWAGEMLTRLCGARRVVAFDGPPGTNVKHRRFLEALGVDVDPASWELAYVSETDRELSKYAALLAHMGIAAGRMPGLRVSDDARRRAGEVWDELGLRPGETIIFFPGSGDGLVKSPDAATWAAWIRSLARERGGSVLLLGGAFDAECLDEIAACGLPDDARRTIVPSGDLGLLAGLLLDARAYIGADTGPMHVAAALGRPTLGVFGGGHNAERFLPVGPQAAAVRMMLGCYGCGWHCPFDRRACIKEIPLAALESAGEALLNGIEPRGPDEGPRLFDVPHPASMHQGLAGATMRLYRQFLDLNHSVLEHHAYIEELNRQQSWQFAELTAEFRRLAGGMAEMTEHNKRRDEAIQQIADGLSRVSALEADRVNSMEHCLAEMTEHNARRDAAIDVLGRHVERMSAELTELRRCSLRVPSFVYRFFKRLRDRLRSRDQAR